MTYAPATLQNLRSYLIGVGAPVLGIVGNPATHRGGYHLGIDRIYGPSGYGARDYSIQTTRDKAGMSNAASAIDIGRHNRLIELGVYLRGKPDIRELIAERDDGTHVWRYVDGRLIGKPDSQELPHHLHVSYFRDSETRDKRPTFRAFYEPEEDPMGLRFQLLGHAVGFVTVNGDGHALIRVYDSGHVPVPAGQKREVYARVRLREPLDANPGNRRDGWLIGETWPPDQDNYEAAFVLASDVTFTEE